MSDPQPYTPYGPYTSQQPVLQNDGSYAYASPTQTGSPYQGPLSSASGAVVGQGIKDLPPYLANAPAAADAAPPGLLASALPAAGIAAGAYTGVQQFEGANKFGQGKPLSFQEQVALALPTGGFSFLANPLQKLLGIGHHDADTTNRMGLKNQLASGPLGASLSFQGNSGPLSLGRAGYNVDFTNPLSQQAVGYANPLASILAQNSGDHFGKSQNDLAGEIANTIMQGANNTQDVKNNILSLAHKLNLKPAAVKAGLQHLHDTQQLNDNQLQASLQAVENLTHGKGAQIKA